MNHDETCVCPACAYLYPNRAGAEVHRLHFDKQDVETPEAYAAAIFREAAKSQNGPEKNSPNSAKIRHEKEHPDGKGERDKRASAIG